MGYLEVEGDFELIKEKKLHFFIGVSKEDKQALIQKYPDIPSIELKGTLYFSKVILRKWLESS